MSDEAHAKRASPVPPEGAPARRVVIPELRALQDARYVLARGGKPPAGERTPEDCARVSAFHTLSLLLRILLRFKQKVENGERCRLVEKDHVHESERVVIELMIEPIDESGGTGGSGAAPVKSSVTHLL